MKKFQDLVARLRMYGKIQPGYVLDINPLQIDTNSYCKRLTKTYKTYVLQDATQNRNAGLDKIRMDLEEAFEELGALNNCDSYKYDILVNAIKETLQGVPNLSKTYARDLFFVSCVETIVETYSAKLNTLSNSLET